MRKHGFSVVIVVILATIAVVGVLILVSRSEQPPQGVSLSEKRNFVAIGASFTKANNLSSKLAGDNPEYSFATGTKIESVYQYLKNKGEELSAKNLAESGVNSQRVLDQQVPNALSYQPKYVTIDIMIDIFEDEKPIKFKQNLTEIARQIKARDNIVLVSTYPNITALRKAPYSSCAEDKLGIGINKVTEEKILLFNQVINDIARDFDLIVVDNFNTLTIQDVSDYDCLHPNIEGQKKLAKVWIDALKEEVSKK